MYKKRSYRKPMYKRANYGSRFALKKVQRDIRMIKKHTKPEYGIKDAQQSGVAPTTTSTLQLLNGVGSGSAATTRDGRVAVWKSFQMIGSINKHASASATVTRFILFYDKSPSGVAPTAAQLLDLSSVNAVYAFRNLDFRGRFDIIRDWRVHVDADDPEKYFKKYCKFTKKTIYDDSNNADITDINTGAIYLLTVSDEATNTPTVDSNMRLRFERS